MRTEPFFTNVDASVQQISQSFLIECGQDMRYLFQVVKTGTDGDPDLFLEESLDDIMWTLVPNYETLNQGFPLDEDVIGLRDSYFMGKYIRLRMEPNGTTTGTINAVLGIKTKSV
jgi:hypothetical protein